jgi:RNA polymerase sigma factor (sigma-70 family)
MPVGDIEGDRAPEEVCRDLYPRLVGALGLFCGDSSAGEDLAQEALARWWQRWPTEGPDSPLAWCYRVGVNLARSAARRRAVEQRVLGWMRADIQRDAFSAPVADIVAVRAAVAELPARQRQAIVGRYYLGLSVQECAATMGCAAGTVTALTHQAIASLRKAGLLASSEDVDVGKETNCG